MATVEAQKSATTFSRPVRLRLTWTNTSTSSSSSPSAATGQSPNDVPLSLKAVLSWNIL
ncbi:MAG: hypothetical protein HOG32_03140 [Polaribacter sp.]|nr:hypothetical protein [Polaribacter sp.]